MGSASGAKAVHSTARESSPVTVGRLLSARDLYIVAAAIQVVLATCADDL